MDALTLSKYQDDPILEVLLFFIENSVEPNRSKFLAQIDSNFLIDESDLVNGTLDDWKNKATFPYRIVTSNDKIAKELTRARTEMLLQDHNDPVIREYKRVLLSTLYPWQLNDCFIRRIPSFNQDAGNLIPVDWQLVGLVDLLWQNGIALKGWDVADDSFITAGYNATLEYQLNEDDIPSAIFRERFREMNEQIDRVLNGCKNIVNTNGAIEVKTNRLKRVYKCLGLEWPDKTDPCFCRGGLIPYWR